MCKTQNSKLNQIYGILQKCVDSEHATLKNVVCYDYGNGTEKRLLAASNGHILIFAKCPEYAITNNNGNGCFNTTIIDGKIVCYENTPSEFPIDGAKKCMFSHDEVFDWFDGIRPIDELLLLGTYDKNKYELEKIGLSADINNRVLLASQGNYCIAAEYLSIVEKIAKMSTDMALNANIITKAGILECIFELGVDYKIYIGVMPVSVKGLYNSFFQKQADGKIVESAELAKQVLTKLNSNVTFGYYTGTTFSVKLPDGKKYVIAECGDNVEIDNWLASWSNKAGE